MSGLPAVTNVSTRPSDLETCRFFALAGTSAANFSAVPRQRFVVPFSS